MAYKNGIIQTETISQKNYGISIDDLRRCFQVRMSKSTEKKYSTDLGAIIRLISGEQIGGWTIEDRQNINIWAKFKPVKSSNNFPANVSPSASSRLNTYPLLKDKSGGGKYPQWETDTTKLHANFHWWRDTVGADANCKFGIVPVVGSTPDAILNSYLQGDEWAYYRPTGGAEYPYRILDFLNYNHFAQKPAGVEPPSRTVAADAWSVSLSMRQTDIEVETNIDNRDFITPADILKEAFGGSLYFGFALIQKVSQNQLPNRFLTTAQTIQSSQVARYDVTKGDTYYIVPLFTNQKVDLSIGSSYNNAKFATVPYSSVGELIISETADTEGWFVLKATISPTGKRIALTAKISTQSTDVSYGDKQYNHVTIYICDASTTNAQISGPPNSYIEKFTLGDNGYIHLPANSEWSQSISYMIPNDYANTNFLCFLYENGKRQVTAYPKRTEWEPPVLLSQQ